jgi:hypothetical protein
MFRKTNIHVFNVILHAIQFINEHYYFTPQDNTRIKQTRMSIKNILFIKNYIKSKVTFPKKNVSAD